MGGDKPHNYFCEINFDSIEIGGICEKEISFEIREKPMKKILVLFKILVLCLAITACQIEDTENRENANEKLDENYVGAG